MKIFLGIIFLVAACSEERTELRGSLKNGTGTARQSAINPARTADGSTVPGAPALDRPPQSADASTDVPSPVTGGETVTAPQIVNGAYLYCAEISELGTRIEVGCRMNDADGLYIKPELLAGKLTYLPAVPKAEGLAFETITLTQIDRTFDVLYFFDSPSIDISREAAFATPVKVSLENPVQGNSPRSSEAHVKDILSSSGFSVTALVGEKLVSDLVTGVTFTRLIGSFDWNEAMLTCGNLLRAGSDDWVLASLPMLSAAHTHGLMENTRAREALDLLSVENIAFWSYDLADDRQTNAHFMLLDEPDASKVIRIQLKSNVNSVICQR